MIERARGGVFVRMFGSAVIMQAVVSITSLLVGLILIRRSSDAQYGYYVLTVNVIMLLTALQSSFIQPQMVVRLTGATPQERADIVGGLYRDQRRLWPVFGVCAIVAALDALTTNLLPPGAGWVAVAAAIAVFAALYREFFRMLLLAQRLPVAVLKADITYAVLMILGAMVATLTPAPAAICALAVACAATAGGLLCSRYLWRQVPWNIHGAPGILRAIAPIGIVTAAGAAIHWLFSQGYNFLVAGTLDVSAVAAIAATRILIMPVNLLSTGIGTMMLPTTSGWLQTMDARVVLRRLLLLASALALAALGYFAVLWLVRDWLFANVLKKQFAQRDRLLLLWYAVGLLMLLRDQLIYLLLARSRFHVLTLLTFVSALLSLITSYFSMRLIGVTGALWGVITGETISVIGLLTLSFMEVRKSHGATK